MTYRPPLPMALSFRPPPSFPWVSPHQPTTKTLKTVNWDEFFENSINRAYQKLMEELAGSLTDPIRQISHAVDNMTEQINTFILEAAKERDAELRRRALRRSRYDLVIGPDILGLETP